MIVVKDLVKRYGDRCAVDHLSFTIEEGKIYGFLGPNGAGKSTTLNIVTGYLSATEGSVTVDIMPTLDENFVVSETFDYAHLALGSSIAMTDLRVTGIYTTTNEESASKGAMTLTCRSGDQTVSVRTVVLRDADGNVITAEAYQGKTIDVRGIVDYYNGDYQIKVFSADDIIVKD